jgi:transcription termination factor NusB
MDFVDFTKEVHTTLGKALVVDAERLRSFKMAVAVCADDVSKLRRSDVYRCLLNALNQGPRDQSEECHAEYFRAFFDWIKEQRPDLNKQLAEALREIWIETRYPFLENYHG